MNHFRITIEISTTHDSPEEWIGEYIADELYLNEGEAMHSIECKRIDSQFPLDN